MGKNWRNYWKVAVPAFLLGACIAGGAALFLWWNALPAQQFPYWGEETSPDPSGEGATLWIEVDREENGSGKVSYTVDNLSTLARLQATTGGEQWVDFSQGGTFHRVTESLSRDEGPETLDVGDAWTFTAELPPETLALPGRYRFCVEGVGAVPFTVNPNGTVEAENGEPVHSSMGTGGLMVAMDTEDLMEGSHLVAVCRLKEVSRPFRIRSAGSEGNGGLQNYTDYYFEVLETLRGEAAGPVIAVRSLGGRVGALDLEVDEVLQFQEEENYLLFLYQPGMGGNFHTEGDYYYVYGNTQGMYLCGDTASLRGDPNGSVRNAYTEEGLSVDAFLKQLDQVNKDHPPQPEKAKEEYLQYLRDRVGVDGYTQEEYDQVAAGIQVYATYASNPPSYSGGE